MLEFYGWWDWLFHANVTSGISSSVDYRKSKVFTQKTRGRRTSGCTVQETNHHLSFLQEWGCSDGQCPVWATKINRLNPHLCSCSNPKFSPSLSKADFPKAREDIDKHHGGFTNTSLQAGCLSAPVGVLWLLSEGTLQMSLLRSSQILPSGTEHFHASEREQWAHIQGWDWTPSRVGKRICCVTKIGQVPCHIWQMPQMAGHGFGGLLKELLFPWINWFLVTGRLVASFSLAMKMGLSISGQQGTNHYYFLIPNVSLTVICWWAIPGWILQVTELFILTYSQELLKFEEKKLQPFTTEVAKSGAFLLKVGCDDLPGFRCFQT